MRPDLADLLKEFSALSDADRKAILKRLSVAERRALRKARRKEQVHPGLRALSACSPKVAKQLALIVQSEWNSRRLGVSEAATQALMNALNSTPVASNEPASPRDVREQAS